MLKIEPLGDGSYGWVHGIARGKAQFKIDIQPIARHGARVEAGAYIDFVNLEGDEGIPENDTFLVRPAITMYLSKWAEENGLGKLGPPNGRLF